MPRPRATSRTQAPRLTYQMVRLDPAGRVRSASPQRAGSGSPESRRDVVMKQPELIQQMQLPTQAELHARRVAEQLLRPPNTRGPAGDCGLVCLECWTQAKDGFSSDWRRVQRDGTRSRQTKQSGRGHNTGQVRKLLLYLRWSSHLVQPRSIECGVLRTRLPSSSQIADAGSSDW